VCATFKKGYSNLSSKRTGLEKAVYRIGQAIARSKANGGELEDEQAALNLQHLLSSTAGLLPKIQEPQTPQLQAPASVPTHHDTTTTATAPSGYTTHGSRDNNYSLDDAENPLQLLASASGMALSPRPLPNAQPPTSYVAKDEQDKDLQTFFGPFSPNLDVSEDIDPIDMGYITSGETTALFNLYVMSFPCSLNISNATASTKIYLTLDGALTLSYTLPNLSAPDHRSYSPRFSLHLHSFSRRQLRSPNGSLFIARN
jgi:hypothetical protein